jgi:hypothetical protein
MEVKELGCWREGVGAGRRWKEEGWRLESTALKDGKKKGRTGVEVGRERLTDGVREDEYMEVYGGMDGNGGRMNGWMVEIDGERERGWSDKGGMRLRATGGKRYCRMEKEVS